MNERHHEEWVLQLSDYLDGDLETARAQALEVHLAECASCRGILADLRDIVAQAGALGGVEPSRDLWPSIARAIAPDQGPARVIPFPGAAGRARRRPGLFVTGPQLAAASVVLVLASAAATWWAGIGLAGQGAAAPAGVTPPSAALVDDRAAPSPELAEELATLEAVLADARHRLDPNTVRIVEKNLGVIQRAIDESARALAVDPANAFLREHLQRAYREKAAFLREVGAIVDWEG